MILVTAITPAGARLAVKTASGIVILETVGKENGIAADDGGDIPHSRCS